MGRGELILRHWNLLRRLQTRGVGSTLRELSEQFDVSERTIQRDLEILQEIGFPIGFEEDEFGKRFWRLPPDYFRSGPFLLSPTEAIALRLADHLFAPLAGTMFADGLAALREKIESLLPATAVEHFRDLDRTVHVRRTAATDNAQHADKIRTLTHAAMKSLTVEATYSPLWRPQEPYTTRFDPYGLVLFEGDVYAVGRSHRVGAVRVFKVSRIAAVAATATPFETPEDFRLEEHFADSFGIIRGGGPTVEVAVRFTGPAAGLVEERLWHESQRIERLVGQPTLFEVAPGEREAIHAVFQLAELVEFKRWLKGFGADAEVIRPESLRAAMRAELRAAAAVYENS